MGKRSVTNDILKEFALWLVGQGKSDDQVETLLGLEPGTVAQWLMRPVSHHRHGLAPVVDALFRKPWDDERVCRGCLLRRPRDNESGSPPW